MTKPTLVLTFDFDAPPQRVFDVFTQAQHLNKWFTNAAEVDLQVGGKVSNGDGESGKFVKVAVPHHLVFTYNHTKVGVETEIDVTFEPSVALGRTRMRLIQKGLDPKEVSKEAYTWLIERWNYMGLSLKRYLAREAHVSFDNWRAKRQPVSGAHD